MSCRILLATLLVLTCLVAAPALGQDTPEPTGENDSAQPAPARDGSDPSPPQRDDDRAGAGGVTDEGDGENGEDSGVDGGDPDDAEEPGDEAIDETEEELTDAAVDVVEEDDPEEGKPKQKKQIDFWDDPWGWGMEKVEEAIDEWKKSKSVRLTDEIVTSLRRPQKLRHCTQTVHLVKDKEIGSKGAIDLDQTLVTAPGVEVWTRGWWGAATRLSLRGTYQQHTLVVVDGRPLNALWDGVADIGWVPLVAADQIEVVKGPSSHVWGSGAMGGVVQVLTMEPTDQLSGTGGGMIYSRDSYELRGYHSWKIGNLGYFIGGAIRKTPGDRSNSDFASDDNFVKIVWDVEPGKFKLRYSNWIHRDVHGVPGPQPDPDAPFGISPFGDDESYSLFDTDKQRLYSNTLTGEYEVDDETMVRLTAYHDYRWYRTDTRSFAINTSEPSANFSAYHKNNIFGLSLRADLDNRIKDHKITLALEFKEEDYIFRNYETAVYDTYNPDPERIASQRWERSHRTIGFWATDQWRLAEDLTLVGGFRFDFHSQSWNQDGYHLGLAYSVDDSTVARISFGRSYRFPSIFELYYKPNDVSHPWSDVNYRVQGNVRVAPEKLWGAEAGFSTERAIKDLPIPLIEEMRIFAQASVFYHFLWDQIDGLPPVGVNQVENLHRKTVWGAEISVRAHPATFLLLDFNYCWLWAYGYQYECYDQATPSYHLKWRRSDQIPKSYGRFEAIINTGVGLKIIYFARYTGSRVNWMENTINFPLVTYDRVSINHQFEQGVYFSYDFLGVATFYAGYQAYPGQDDTATEIDPYYSNPSMGEATYPTPQDGFTVGVSAGGSF